MKKIVLIAVFSAILSVAAWAAVIEQYSDYGPSTGNPAFRAVAVTPNDTNDLAFYCTAVWVGGAGNLAVVMAHDHLPGMSSSAANTAAVVFNAVNAGQWMPIRVGRIQSTNTTATNIDCVQK